MISIQIGMRYQISAVHRQETAIAAVEQTLGWRAYASNTQVTQLSLPEAVLSYRDEWIVEHGFHRLKGAPLSLSPLFVQRDDQVKGLLTLIDIPGQAMGHVPPLNLLQQEILRLLGLPPDIYSKLVGNSA